MVGCHIAADRPASARVSRTRRGERNDQDLPGYLGDHQPVGWRLGRIDKQITRRDVRAALDRAGFDWVTSHSFRKTTATMLDEAGLSARMIADQLGHARPSMTQDVYMGRKAVDARVAEALEDALGKTPPSEAPPIKSE